MSTRYGISLAIEPGFTARAYRARQLICGQYASWAAEMHMVFLPLYLYFECPDSTLELLDGGLAEIAAQSKQNAAQFSLSHRGVGSHLGDGGHIFLDFAGPNDSREPERSPKVGKRSAGGHPGARAGSAI